jgi:hypothetical protein
MKTCKCGCGDPFTPARNWQEFCTPDCRLRYNTAKRPPSETKLYGRDEARRRANERRLAKKVEALDAPLSEHEREICHEGVYMLCAAIFESAYKDRDHEFFKTDMARLICDSVGVDPQWALMKARE